MCYCLHEAAWFGPHMQLSAMQSEFHDCVMLDFMYLCLDSLMSA